MNWLRWYVGTCTDAKLHKASRLAHVRRSAVIASWAAILEEARRNGDDGTVGELEPSWLGCQIDEPEAKCERILQAMRDVGMIDEKSVISFSRRQFASDDSAARMRAWRAKRLKQHETSASCDVTSDERVTTCDKQTRTEQNRKKERPLAEAQRNASPNGSSGKPDPSRGTRLSQDWEPGEKGVEYARNLGMSADAINSTYHAFMRYWLAKAGKEARKADWNLTWQTWVRREHERLREQADRERLFQQRYGAGRTAH